jgi:nucleoside-diphosphate-sugar epimerase
MTSLVTGATGFVGRHLVAHLAAQGESVRALYRDPAKAKLHLGPVAESVVGDICDRDTMNTAVAGAGIIYHCAAAHSTAPADEIRRTTVPALRVLFEAVCAAGGSPRIILMSSLNVLGNVSYSNATEKSPRRKTKELHVDLKIEAEQLAEEWIAKGMEVVILRPGLIYGPGEPHVPKLAEAIYKKKFVYIGSRDNIVPLVHVSDMVEAMRLAGQSNAPRRVYQITDGSQTTISDLVRHLARILQCPEPTRVLPTIVPRVANSVFEMIGKRGPVSRAALRFLGSSRHVDIQRARNELGFQPRVNISEGLESMKDWLRESVLNKSAA